MEYFERLIYENQGSNIYPMPSFNLTNVDGDGNCGYRPLTLQIYEDEEVHYKIREDICNYLHLNAEWFTELNFQVDGILMAASEYIEKVQEEGFWIWDLELNNINNANLYVYELGNDLNVYL